METAKAQVCCINLPLVWDNIPPAMKMMRRMKYIPGLGLGKHLQGTHQVIQVKEQTSRVGLGYKPTSRDKKESKEVSRQKRLAASNKSVYVTPDLRPYSLDIGQYFTRQIVNPGSKEEHLPLDERPGSIIATIGNEDPLEEIPDIADHLLLLSPEDGTQEGNHPVFELTTARTAEPEFTETPPQWTRTTAPL